MGESHETSQDVMCHISPQKKQEIRFCLKKIKLIFDNEAHIPTQLTVRKDLPPLVTVA